MLADGRALAVVVDCKDFKDRRAVTAAIPRMFDGTPFERCSGTELCGTNRKGCAGVETLDTGVSTLLHIHYYQKKILWNLESLIDQLGLS